MSTVSLSENELTIITEYSRIKGIDSEVLLRRGVDIVVKEAVGEQMKKDFINKNIEADVVSLFEERDYIRLMIMAKNEDIPASVIAHLKSRPAEV
jgi:hypothetical protein